MEEDKSSVPHFSEKVGDTSLAREESDKEKARIYEVGYLIVPTIPEADVPREVTAIKDVLEREKAVVISEEFPKFRQLAYRMYKRKRLTASPAQAGGRYDTCANAYFGWVKFEGTPERVTRIEMELQKSANILRFLLVKTVRETTMVGARPPRQDGVRVKREIPSGAPAPNPVSEAELDKSIEKLIAE